MKKTSRLLAALLALALLPACGGPAVDRGGQEIAAYEMADSGTIAYVPLDDRPDNVERVEYLAESLGYTLELPDADLYATKLDGQPLGAGGSQSGDRGALYEWVLAREAAGCDRYILFLDQLLSGGLVNSRHSEGVDPVALSDGRTLTETALLSELLSTLAADQKNEVWLLDTVMRLAPTVGYAGFGLEEYNALRDFGMLPRPELTGGVLTVENILSGYWHHADGTQIQPESPLFYGQATHYLAARERKLRLSQALFQTLGTGNYENFHVLYGVDDSSAEDSIQKNEIAYLRQNLREGDALLSGVDDLAFKAVTKLYLSECGAGGSGPSVFVQYFGGTENRPACAYDYQPLNAIVDEHLDFFGLRENTNPYAAGFQILILTAPADPAQSKAYYTALVDALKENQKNQIPTVLIDAANDAYGTAFHDALVKEVDLGLLLAYSGFLDMAIVTGTALSHGVARYAWLTHGGANLDTRANQAFIRTLADSVLKDFCYRNTLRGELSAYVRDELGGSPDNFFQPQIDRDAVLEKLETGMAENTKAALRNFSESNFIISPEPYTEMGCGELTLSDYSFPWNRVFECDMRIEVGPFTTPHRPLFG